MTMFHRLLVGWLAFGAPWFLPGMHGQVSNPADRQAAIALAHRLLSREPAAGSLPAHLIDPFNPPAFGAPSAKPNAKKAAGTRGALSDREVLHEIAGQIVPSGMMVFGNDRLLLFGEKKFKVGDSLIIAFEGKKYVITIAAIGQSSFTLRLNHEEITRPIKSGNAQ